MTAAAAGAEWHRLPRANVIHDATSQRQLVTTATPRPIQHNQYYYHLDQIKLAIFTYTEDKDIIIQK